MRYEIKGEPMPVAICYLDSGETMISESGAMSWMSPNMEMQTSGGGMGKVFGRMFSGENLFQNHYTAQGGPGMIAFASSFPGSIRAIEITPSAAVICQKRSFLASTSGVDLSVHFQKKFGAGFFGGEGFIMQKLTGNGMAFIEIDGAAVKYELAAGQQLIVDTGHVVLMSSTCSMDIQTVKGLKNIVLGGEGLFNTVVTGPGEVILQTLPVPKLAGAIQPYMITQGK